MRVDRRGGIQLTSAAGRPGIRDLAEQARVVSPR